MATDAYRCAAEAVQTADAGAKGAGAADGICYLDNSATTRVCEAAAQKALWLMRENFGNPSSLHTLGIRAEEELDAAREAVGTLMGVPADDVVFTSGGTEANNLALLGSPLLRAHGGKHIVITAVEHSSVQAAAYELERLGYEVTRVFPDSDGDISPESISDACRADTALVSMMLVNNETGARFPVEDAVRLVKKKCPAARFHCDAVQAAGKVPLKAAKWGVDFMTVSAHKLHAPKGCGALYIRRGEHLLPRVTGGEQERGIRGGTQAVPLIGAFGAAIGCLPTPAEQTAHAEVLAARLIERLKDDERVVFHLPKSRIPSIVHLSAVGWRSETMMHYLASRGIFVSSGSACAKGKVSAVLTAMNLPQAEIDSALRISFDFDNTEADVDRFADALSEGMRTLARVKP